MKNKIKEHKKQERSLFRVIPDLEESENNRRKHVGKLVKNLENLHDKEYDIVFNLHENTFFQKMIPTEILDKGVRVKPIEYFKALVFLSYHGRIIENDYSACKNLVILSKKLREAEKVREEDGEASYLNLETIVLEAAIFTKERLMKENKKTLFAGKEKQEIEKRYKAENVIDLTSRTTRPLDLYYEAIGEMICSLVGDKTKTYLEETSRRTEIEALVFIDSILPFLTETESKELHTDLKNKDYFSASVKALDKLVKKNASYLTSKFKSSISS